MSALRPEADVHLDSAACPQMTLSGHSVEYAVQQVGEGGRQERDSERDEDRLSPL